MAKYASFQQAFSGKVEQYEYAQCYDFEAVEVPSYYIDGVPQGSRLVRNTMIQKAVQRTYRFFGLNYANAHTTATQTVTDASGQSHSVPLQSEIVDGSSGTRFMPVRSVAVSRRQSSPHLWEVVVTVATMEYYLNGSKVL